MMSFIKEKFDGLAQKIGDLVKTITTVKAVQAQQEGDISHIKQQLQIEDFEERDRRCNLIFSNVPDE
ncbi:MAG: hypothetical protein AAGK05_13650 [Pseudomonadota bacterium]